jgi:hypothetical protein
MQYNTSELSNLLDHPALYKYFKNSFPVNHLPLILSICRITKRDSACVKRDVMGWACDKDTHDNRVYDYKGG